MATQPTDAEIAKHFGVTARTIRAWRTAGAPLTESLEAVQKWREEQPAARGGRPRKAAIVPVGELRAQLLRAQVARTKEQARAERLANDEAEGELVRRVDAVLEFSELCGMIRSDIEAWPAKVVQELPQESRQVALSVLDDAAHLLLTRMARFVAPSIQAAGEEIAARE